MGRRQFITILLAIAAAMVASLGLRRRPPPPPPATSPFDRVLLVCCGDHGNFSPAIYWHGPTGGGPACLEEARKAAPFMRAGEPDDSAAGLSGYLFRRLGDDVASGGGLSLRDAPQPRPDGTVDWQAYCSWNVDLILINVDRGTAECYVSPEDDENAPSKRLVRRFTGLKFGRR
jgi:hypothetical protein